MTEQTYAAHDHGGLRHAHFACEGDGHDHRPTTVPLPVYDEDGITLYQGDCVAVMAALPAESVDCVITDPPYGLEFMGRGWDAPWKAGEGTGEHNAGFSRGAPAEAGVRGEIRALPSYMGATNPSCRNCGGTRGGNDRKSRKACRCDAPEFPNTNLPRMKAFEAWCQTWAVEALRVLKPGGHLLAFGGTRTFHRLTCGLEDAGFEIRDCLSWLYGSGFPKSLNLGDGRGTALKPAWEPCIVARKPLRGTVAANVARYGTGALNIDACRIPAPEGLTRGGMTKMGGAFGNGQAITNPDGHPAGRWPANVALDEWDDPVLRLRYNVPDGAREAILAYFGELRPVRIIDARLPEQSGEIEVLRDSVLRAGAEGPQAADGGAQALGGIVGEDAGEQAQDGRARRSKRAMARRAPSVAGLRDGEHRDAIEARAGVIRADDQPQQRTVHPRASAGDGAEVEAPAALVGVGASPQRDQERQPTGQSADADERRSSAGASGGLQRATATPSRERSSAFEVEESRIPEGWLTYFEPTGRSTRRGAAAMLDAQSGERKAGGNLTGSEPSRPFDVAYGEMNGRTEWDSYGDSGGASRFFYTAKASRSEREAWGRLAVKAKRRTDGRSKDIENPRLRTSERVNDHPTVKPLALMEWLIRLVLPEGGIVLDPFAGSGTTLVAAKRLRVKAIGIEQDERSAEIAKQRIAAQWEVGLL